MQAIYKVGLVCTALVLGCGNPKDSTESELNYAGGEIHFSHQEEFAKSVVAIETKKEGADFKVSCSGVVIKQRWILTAAHCVMPVDPIKATVRSVFDYDEIRIKLQHDLYFDVDEIKFPQGFSIFKSHAERPDIALIKTKEFIPSNKRARLADPKTFKKWQDENFLTGLRLRGVGYGHRDSQPYSGGQLNFLDIPYISEYGPLRNKRTLASVNANGKTYDEGFASMEFMAGIRNMVACQGDSGGAAFFEYKGKWYLKGILSRAMMFYGQPDSSCGPASLTAIYADVSQLQNWLNRQTSRFN